MTSLSAITSVRTRRNFVIALPILIERLKCNMPLTTLSTKAKVLVWQPATVCISQGSCKLTQPSPLSCRMARSHLRLPLKESVVTRRTRRGNILEAKDTPVD